MISQRPSEVEANVQSARSRTAQLEQDLLVVLSILRSSLRKPPFRWEDLTHEVSFDALPPQKPEDPEKVIKAPYPTPPDRSAFIVELTLSDKLLGARGKQKSAEAAARQESAEAAWRNQCAEIDKTYNEAVALRESLYQEKFKRYETALSAWETSRNEHIAKQDQQREQISTRRSDYNAAKAPAVEYLLTQALARSEYPKTFPKSSSVNFDENSGVLIVDFQLPTQPALPTIKEVKYIATRDEFQEIPLSVAWMKKTYEDALYQIALRTLHELYKADESQVLNSIVFNGWIQSTGSATRIFVLSIQANREEFLQINLGQIDPRACFQKLNGIASENLSEPSPIQPILILNKEAATSVETSASAVSSGIAQTSPR